jgi:phospholipase D1/2
MLFRFLVRDYNNNLIERKLLARMPWHDVSVGVAGQPARDIARHFVQRWNFVKLEKGMKKSHMKFLMPKGEFVSTRNESGWTGTQKVQILRSSTLWSQGVDLERSIQDAYLSAIQFAEHFIYIENQFFGKYCFAFICYGSKMTKIRINFNPSSC